MPVTIKDLAKRLGVSPTAVSKALNDRDDVSAELKAKVLKLAEEMDYSVNSIAQRLVTNKSNTLGVFVLSRQKTAVGDNIGFSFISGILEEANQRGYDIVLFSTDSDLVAEKSYIKLCQERRVEGAIFCGLRLDDPHVEEIKKANFPIAIIDTYLPGKNTGFISTDNEKGVVRALQYLWNLGHRKIAMINGHDKAQVSQVRYKAFQNFLEKKGIYCDDYIFSGDFSKDSGYELALKIMGLKELPTALFIASDLMALGAIQAFKKAGMTLPRDMSIIGFDNISSGEYVEPSLTTVGQDAFAMGSEAARWVINKLGKQEVPSAIKLEPQLIIRDSCTVPLRQ